MPGGQGPNPKIPVPSAPRASLARPGSPQPTRIVGTRHPALTIAGTHSSAQDQRQRPGWLLARRPAAPRSTGSVARVSAPPVYRPIMAAQIQSRAAAVKAPVPPPVFRPQIQGLSPKPGSMTSAPRTTPNSPHFQNPTPVQRACLFSWCFGGGSGGGEKQPPEKSVKELLIPKPKALPKNVTIPEGHYNEIREGEMATAEFITSCTFVYVRSGFGRVVIYHWPKTRVSHEHTTEMQRAVESIGATKSVVKIKLFTKSKVGLQDLIDHLKKYTSDIETVLLGHQSEPFVDFSGEQLF